MPKIAIVGAGAMGCVLGAYLAKGGGDVVLVDPFKAHMDKIAADGLIMNSASGTEVVKLNTAYDASEIGVQDYVVIMVKGTLTALALEGALPAIGENTFVCTFQNGIGNVDIITEKIPKEKVLYGCLNMTSILKGPGEIYGNLFDEVNVHVGSVVREEAQQEAGEAIAAVFTAGGAPARYDKDDIDTYVWSKAMVNIVVNGTLGLVRLRGKDVATNRYFQQIVINLSQEALAVAEAKGVPGLDFNTFFTKVLPAARKDGGDHYPSMAQDIMIGKKKTEIEFLNGAVEKMGKELGIPTPVNATVANFIRVIEDNYDKQYYE
ncbi:MAG: 2-dehydropantoate 2-reductase [Clostridiales Family XIII bacterium]|jgi:2-dehydropantoate 2-reductase|nr:2-dehydropantoate 2-reductase [Clostridiales Family XIII bacterium]